MGGEADISEELLESIQDAVGRNVKICMRKKVQLEVKGDKLENRILALAPHRAFLLSARAPVRAEQTFSLFDIQAVDSSKPNQLMLDYDKGQLSLKLTSTEEVDEVIAQIGTSIQEHCPGLSPERVMKKLSLKPAERLANLHALWENNPSTDTGPCGAFSRMYWCVCDQLGLPFREEVQWDVDTIYLSQDTRELNLQDFIHLENRDLLAIVAVLEYNQWFTKLSLKDYKLSTDLCDQILRVVSRSGRLEELVLENTGLKADFAQKLASALSQNTDSALHTLNLANNSLEDKGIAYLSSSMGKLRCGLKVLNLSRNSLSARGVNILAQALCSNPSVFSALAHLDLSGNSLRGDDMPSLWNFLGQPNKLQILDLCNCDCSLELVCSSLLRGSLKHLTVLSMSKSVFNLKKGKELPSSFKQFFSSAQALNSIVLSGTKLPLEALKALLLGLASNPNLKDVSLDLSSCELRSAGSQILEGCIAEIPNISSLDISDNGLDSDLITLLVWLAKNRSIRHLALGKNFNNIKAKNLGQVLSGLVHMIQEEESPLSSLSLADSKLKADLSIVLNAVGGNSSLTHLDISGNSMGDMGAKMLAKALQINTKLRTVIWDRNNVSAQGLQDVAAALEKNYTIRFMPVPIMDAAMALKSSPEKTEDALMKMEQYLLRNHETRRYLQEQAYRLQQGIVTSTTQQMIGRLCVKVQDHLNSLRFSKRASIQEDMRAAERLVQDARNSKKLLASMYHLHSSLRGGGVEGGAGQSPWVGPIQDKLQKMAGEISTVVDQQLQSLLVSMIDTAEGVCPHVMYRANLRPALMRAGEGRMSVSQAFITSTLLGQSGVDIINKISEVKLSMASFLSDHIIDEILESLSRTQLTLAEHLIRRGQPLLHHDSEEPEVLDETKLQSENLPPPPTELLLTPTSKRKSILFRMVRPVSVAFELEFDLDKALENVPIHMEDPPLPPPPSPLREELERQESVGLSDLPITESPKLEHITKHRPRRKKTVRPFRGAALKSTPAMDLGHSEQGGKLDEGVDDFYTKKVTKIRTERMSVKDSVQEGERKRESRMSGFFNRIKSRSSTRTPPTSPHTPATGASVVPTVTGTEATAASSVILASVNEPMKTGLKSPAPEQAPGPIKAQSLEKVEPCEPVDVPVTLEPKGQEEGKKHEAPPAGRVRGVQVMSNDFLVQLRAKQDKMKEKTAESFPSKGKAEPSRGEGDSANAVNPVLKEHHPEPKIHFPHTHLKPAAHAPAHAPGHAPATTPAPAPAPATSPIPSPVHASGHAPATTPTPAPALAPASAPAPATSPIPSPVHASAPATSAAPAPSPGPVLTPGPPPSSSESTLSSHPGPLSPDHPPCLEHRSGSQFPSIPQSSPPVNTSTSATSDVSGHPSAGSSPKLPGMAPVHRGALCDTHVLEHSPYKDTPHLVAVDALEDSVFDSESFALPSPTAGQRCTSLQSSINPPEEMDDRQRTMSLPIPAGLPTPPGSPFGLDDITAVSLNLETQPEHAAEHSSPTPAHTSPPPAHTSPTPAHTSPTPAHTEPPNQNEE